MAFKTPNIWKWRNNPQNTGNKWGEPYKCLCLLSQRECPGCSMRNNSRQSLEDSPSWRDKAESSERPRQKDSQDRILERKQPHIERMIAWEYTYVKPYQSVCILKIFALSYVNYTLIKLLQQICYFKNKMYVSWEYSIKLDDNTKHISYINKYEWVLTHLLKEKDYQTD